MSGCFGLDALGLESFLQFSCLEHLTYDVAAADKLALDVKLRDRRPIGNFLDTVAYAVVGQDVAALELNTNMAQHLNHH